MNYALVYIGPVSNNIMAAINEVDCREIISLLEADTREGMTRMADLLHTYQQKYAPQRDPIVFRADTKLVFQVLKKGIADQKDKAEFITFVANIDFVLEKIDTVDLKNPDQEFSDNCSNAMDYLNQKNKEMDGLTNSTQKVLSNLDVLMDTLKLKIRLDSLKESIKIDPAGDYLTEILYIQTTMDSLTLMA